VADFFEHGNVPKRDEITRECRKLHNEELNDLYFPPSFIRMIKSRRIRYTVDGACGTYRGGEVYTESWRGNRRGRDRLEDPGVDGMIILLWIIRMWGGEARTGLICLRVERIDRLLQRR
jgi:hypothetical protein